MKSLKESLQRSIFEAADFDLKKIKKICDCKKVEVEDGYVVFTKPDNIISDTQIWDLQKLGVDKMVFVGNSDGRETQIWANTINNVDLSIEDADVLFKGNTRGHSRTRIADSKISCTNTLYLNNLDLTNVELNCTVLYINEPAGPNKKYWLKGIKIYSKAIEFHSMGRRGLLAREYIDNINFLDGVATVDADPIEFFDKNLAASIAGTPKYVLVNAGGRCVLFTDDPNMNRVGEWQFDEHYEVSGNCKYKYAAVTKFTLDNRMYN